MTKRDVNIKDVPNIIHRIVVPEFSAETKWVKAIVISENKSFIGDLFCRKYSDNTPMVCRVMGSIINGNKSVHVSVLQRSDKPLYGGRIKIEQSNNQITIWVANSSGIGISSIIIPYFSSAQCPIQPGTPSEDAIEYY